MTQNGKVIKNAWWIIISKIVQSLLSLVISTISARYLGPANYGIISYASSIVAFMIPIAQLGIRNTLVQEIVEHPDEEGKILGTTILSCMVSSVFSIVGIIGFVTIVNRGEVETIIVCILYSISMIFQMSEMIVYWFQAKLLSKFTSITSLLAYIIVSIYKVFLLATQKSIYYFAIVNALDFLIISIILLWIYKKVRGQKLTFSFSLLKRMVSKSKYYIISGMMVTLFSQTDKIMLKLMIDDTEAGLYQAAIACSGLTTFIFSAIIDSYRPIIFESKKKSQLTFNDNVSRLFSVVFYLGLLQSVFLTFFSKSIVGLLYGNEYNAAVKILQIITWYSAFSYIGSIRNIWILAEEKQHLVLRINFCGALLNVFGNFLLIPLLGGIGAAIATVGTQIFTNFVLCYILKEIKPYWQLILNGLKPKTFIDFISDFKEGVKK